MESLPERLRHKLQRAGLELETRHLIWAALVLFLAMTAAMTKPVSAREVEVENNAETPQAVKKARRPRKPRKKTDGPSPA